MKKYNKIILLLMIFIIAFMSIAAIKEYRRITNLRVKGWLFCDTSWAGVRQWENSAAADTIPLSGISATTHYIYVSPRVNIGAHSLSANVGANDDTIFVACDASLSNSIYYFWMVLAK